MNCATMNIQKNKDGYHVFGDLYNSDRTMWDTF